jgi:hypothetical protein
MQDFPVDQAAMVATFHQSSDQSSLACFNGLNGVFHLVSQRVYGFIRGKLPAMIDENELVEMVEKNQCVD